MAAPRTWIDPRFLIGAALVAISIVGVFLVVQAASRSTTVWVAATTLLPGDVIESGDVVQGELRLAEADAIYLVSGTSPIGLLVTSTVGDGEAVPVSAVGDASSVDVAPVVLQIASGMPSSVEPGAVVDVWSATPAEQGAFAPPSILVDDATVVGIVEQEGLIADRSSVRVEVLVARDETSAVLDAIANEHALSLVPAGIPVEQP